VTRLAHFLDGRDIRVAALAKRDGCVQNGTGKIARPGLIDMRRYGGND